jgi:crotonobetainyl-CoA:carnitine CoA-transferase CaiB-like acyl-CoA transferase
VFAGPFGCYQLALLGADVIKIERRGGEDMRRSPLSKEWAERNMATAWMAINSNRRNIALDLTTPKAIEIVRRLVPKADVVMENFRPGIMDKLGIGYDALSAINPKLIYCAVSGFGQNGPERTTAAFAVASALYQRTHTGRGQMVDVAMLGASLSFLSSFLTDYTIGGHLQGQSGNRAQSRMPTADVFKVKGGHILLAVNNEKQFGALSRAIGKPELAKDPRFVDWPARVANDAALRVMIEEVFASDEAKTWEARLTAADVPCSRVWSIAEIVEHPQLAHRDLLQRVQTRYGGQTFVGSGFKLAHGGGSIGREPALPGEHAEEILEEAGYGPADIAALRADRVI